MSYSPRVLAVVLIAVVWASGASAQEVGRVILSMGEVTIQRGADIRPAPVGSTLQNGDTIRVGASSNAQVRFVDEAIVALRPGTDLVVNDYNWPGAANGLERAFFSLLKGGLRTVTGVIGKANQQNYRVTTPTSSIGIRGTNFNVVHCDAECANRDGRPARGGTYGGIFDGRINVGNDAGERVFGADEFFYVASRASTPEALIGPPPFLGDRLAGAARRKGQKGSESTEGMAQSGASADSRPLASAPPAPPQTFVATEERTTSGTLVTVPPSTAVTHVLSVANSSSDGSGSNEAFAVNVSDLTFSGSGASETLVSVVVPVNTQLGQKAGKGEVGPGGTDMVGYGAAVNAHWGRWVDGKVTDEHAASGVFVPPGGVHYMYSDQITPAELIGARTGTFNYNVNVGGTNPTDNAGNIGAFVNGFVHVNFTNRTAALSAVWNVGGSSYSVTSAPGLVSVHPGIGAGINVDGSNVGSCTGPCGGTTGPIQQFRSSGTFIGPTGNHLPMSIATTNGTQTTSQVRLFFCPTCP